MAPAFAGIARLLILMCALASSAAWSVTLRLLTEENPPFNFTRDGQLTGLYVEVVKEIQRRVGSNEQMEVMPWPRAYRMAQELPNIALFVTTRNKQREHLFQWVGPIGTSTDVFYSLRGAGLHINSVTDAKAVSAVLVPRDWFTHQALVKLGFTNLMTTDSAEQMVKMLMSGRAPLMYANRNGLSTLLEKAGAKMADIEPVYILAKDQGYIAFSLGTPSELVRRWQQTLNKMKEDGTFAVIYEKWVPGETPSGIDPDPEAWPNKEGLLGK